MREILKGTYSTDGEAGNADLVIIRVNLDARQRSHGTALYITDRQVDRRLGHDKFCNTWHC